MSAKQTGSTFSSQRRLSSVKNPLFMVFLLPVVVDVLGTVAGQPAAYWSSGGEVYQEAIPGLHLLLQIHPVLFIVFCLATWLPLTYWLTKRLREPFNIWATMFLLVGHGYNSTVWLRTALVRAGLFAGRDQLSHSLSLIPVLLYVLLVAWVASAALLVALKPAMGDADA